MQNLSTTPVSLLTARLKFGPLMEYGVNRVAIITLDLAIQLGTELTFDYGWTRTGIAKRTPKMFVWIIEMQKVDQASVCMFNCCHLTLIFDLERIVAFHWFEYIEVAGIFGLGHF